MKRLTNFFVAQRHYKHMSRLFYGLFLAVVCVQFLLASLLVGGVSWVLTGEIGFTVILWVLIGILGYFVLGFMIAQHKLKQGGTSIAKSAHAVRLFVYRGQEQAGQEPVFTKEFIRVGDVRQLPEAYKRYYEFATQMSIASGVPLPMLYVLPFETGVNGFVAGFEPNDTVMVLTQGALEKLSNAELYGLIGHEFGHILHGDARLNLRLYMLLTCLTWLYDVVDWLEVLVLGSFDANYHKRRYGYDNLTPNGESVALDGRGWDNYLDRQAKANAVDDEMSAVSAFWVMIPLVVGLVAFRIIGVLGVASAEWLKQQFNHQREYLADATSVQLTRSPEVAEALQVLQAKYSTALYNKSFSTCMSHFFFASPEEGEVRMGMHSHPLVAQRIEAVRFRTFREFGQRATADMDKEALDKAHEFVRAYTHGDLLHVYDYDKKPKPKLKPDTPCDSDNDGDIRTIEFEKPIEKIIDGRLVVEGWHIEPEPVKYTLYPRQATARSDITALGVPMEFEQLKNIQLSWEISQRLTKIAEGLTLVECVLLCRHYQQIDPNMMVGLRQIFLGFGKMPTPQEEVIAPRQLPANLLKAVSQNDRRTDGLLVLMVLRQIGTRLRQKSEQADFWIEPKELEYARYYAHHLRQLIEHEPSFELRTNDFCDVKFNHQNLSDARLKSRCLTSLCQGAVLFALIAALGQKKHAHVQNVCQKRAYDILSWLGFSVDGQTDNLPNNLPKLADEVADNTTNTAYDNKAVAVILAFLVGVQDNSLAMREYDKMMATLRRWSLLAGVSLVEFDEVRLTRLLYQVRALGAMDWLSLLMTIQELPKNPRFASLLDGFATAFLYDGKIEQTEYDILCLIATAWHVPLPKNFVH